MIELLKLEKIEYEIADEIYRIGRKGRMLFIGPVDCSGTIPKKIAQEETKNLGLRLQMNVDFRSEESDDGYEVGVFFCAEIEGSEEETITRLRECVFEYRRRIEQLIALSGIELKCQSVT